MWFIWLILGPTRPHINVCTEARMKVITLVACGSGTPTYWFLVRTTVVEVEGKTQLISFKMVGLVYLILERVSNGCNVCCLGFLKR